MSVNTMTFENAATLLTSLYNQATGQTAITPTSEADFVTMAQTTLRTGYDVMGTAISQVLSRTIFSARPYDAKFAGLQVDSIKFGGHVRKINYLDLDIEADQRYTLVDGQAVDHYRVNKPKAIQTNFYGSNTHQIHYTVYKDQIDQAFESSSQFGSFMAGLITHVSNQIEQINEQERRLVLQNLIGARIDEDDNVVHLLTEYKSDTGNTTITSANWQSEAEFPYFVKWLYGYINTLIRFMGNRSAKYHTNIATYNGANAKPIMRHTPRQNMKGYMLTSLMQHIDASVMSSVFHNDVLKTIDFEAVDFWQSIDDPDALQVTPVVMSATDGTYATGDAVTATNVVGVLFDEEAAGTTIISNWSATTPFNAAGGYWNNYYHWNVRTWNDLTENAVVLMLD